MTNEDEDDHLVQRLEAERPVPAAGFRGELRRQLIASPVGRTLEVRARRLCVAYASLGSVLMLTALAGVAGIGPLAAG